MIKDMIEKMKRLIERLRKLVTSEIWVMNFNKLPPWKARWMKILKVVMIVVTDVPRDRLTLRAQALTYSSLLAIVPLFAVVFSVLKGFGFQNKFGEILLAKLTNSPGVVDQIIGFINNTSVNTLGAIGGAALLFTSVSLFGGIEGTFSDIWHISTTRSFMRKMTDYLFIIMVVPIFVAAALTVSAGNFLGAGFVKTILEIPVLKALVFGIYPFFSIWLVLFLLYMVLINTKVKVHAAIIGAVIAGTVLQIIQGIYVSFASGINNYNIIFGSFAQPILAFIWVNIVWTVVLIGAEIVYAVQNLHAYQIEGKRIGLSEAAKEKTILVLLMIVVRQFRKGPPLPALEDLVRSTQMPVKVVSDLLQEMVELGILVESFNAESRQTVYSPAIDPEQLTVAFVLNRLRSAGVNDIQIECEAEVKAVNKALARFESLLQKTFGKARISSL
jgi:membrane protein